MIRDQLCQPVELIQMPNVVQNMLQPLKDASFDPGRNNSITWQSGFAGIGYNRDTVGRELKTLDDLWTDDLKGRIVVLSEFRDTAALVMQNQGVDIESDWGSAEFENAVAFIEQKIDEGYIRKVKGNSYMEDLTSGNAVAGITWSGDIFVLAYDTEDPSWTFTIPESGGTLWSDNLMVPITSTHRRNAQKLMNYYYDPAVAAELAAWVNFVCPVVGAQAEMEKIDPELAESPWIFPTDRLHRRAQHPAVPGAERRRGHRVRRHVVHEGDGELTWPVSRKPRETSISRRSPRRSATSWPSTTSTSTSRGGRSSPSSARRAAARPPRCG